MSEQPAPIPPQVLAAAGLLLVASLVAAGVGRVTGVGRQAIPEAAVVRTMELRFGDAPDGGVIVTGANGEPVTQLDPGTNGFIRGVMRSLVRSRRLDRVQDDPPFRLTLWADNRLTIGDPATGESIELTGFGRDNRAAFARLLATNSTLAAGGP